MPSLAPRVHKRPYWWKVCTTWSFEYDPVYITAQHLLECVLCCNLLIILLFYRPVYFIVVPLPLKHPIINSTLLHIVVHFAIPCNDETRAIQSTWKHLGIEKKNDVHEFSYFSSDACRYIFKPCHFNQSAYTIIVMWVNVGSNVLVDGKVIKIHCWPRFKFYVLDVD